MAAPIYLQCLGLPRVFGPGDHEIRLRVRKHLAVLVYLAVESGTKHRRERLVDLFWPDVPESAGRQSLATALSMLRSRLGPGVVDADRDHVRIAAGQVRLDLDRLEAGEIAGDEFTPVLDIAGFLEGFEIPGLAEFHHWRDQQQGRLLPAIHRGLLVLVDLARRTGDLVRLGRSADRLLGIDELSEDGIRARMEVAALSGDRITALRIFEGWAARLEEELGARPSSELERMATRLRRRGWDRPSDSKIPTVLTEHWQDRDFVGRAREYRVLYDRWERVRAGETGHVAILGGPGIGKTTLADRFVLAAALEGAITARARCFELERGIPYATIGLLIEALLDRPGASSTDPLALAELARMVPEVARRYPGLPSVPDTQGETARVRFADATLEFFRALMAEHPLILEVDDFQQADDASLAVLHMAMRRISDLPLMVVMTSRPERSDHAASADRIRDGAAHLGLHQLDLGPMPAEDSEALLDALLARSPVSLTNTERRAMLRAAGGVPLAVELLLRNWETCPGGSAALALEAMTVEMARDPEETFRRLAGANLAGLPPTAMMVLHVASILDRRLNELEMYSLVDLSPSQTMAHLASLTAYRALRDMGGGLEFAHPAIRAHAYLAMPGPLRRRLHSSVATRLLEREGAGEDIPGLEVAWHCIRAGRVDEAKPYLLSGAREAMHAGAPQEAELALTSGMHLLDGRDTETAQLLLVEILHELGRWQDSLTILALLEEQGTARKDEVLLLSLLARQRLGRLTDTDLRSCVVSLMDTARSAQLAAVRTLATAVGAVMCERLRDPQLSRQLRLIGEGSVVPHTNEDIASLTHALAMLAAHERDYQASLQFLAQADSAATAAGLNNGLRLRIHAGFGAALMAIGQYEQALHHSATAHAVSIRLDNSGWIGATAASLALCHYRLGRYEEAIHWGQRSQTQGCELQTLLAGIAQVALGHAMLGHVEQVTEATDRLSALFEQHSTDWIRQRALLTCADAMLLVGSRKKALRFAALALPPGSKVADLGTAGPFSRWIAALVLAGLMPPQEAGQLRSIHGRLSALDAIDRAEVLYALQIIEPSDGLGAELLRELEKLPGAVDDQLTRLAFPL